MPPKSKSPIAKLKETLAEFVENESELAKVKPLYEKRTELTALIVDQAMKIKKISASGGLLKERIELKFKSGEHFIIKPNYITAAGIDKGAVSRVATFPLFEIQDKTIYEEEE